MTEELKSGILMAQGGGANIPSFQQQQTFPSSMSKKQSKSSKNNTNGQQNWVPGKKDIQQVWKKKGEQALPDSQYTQQDRPQSGIYSSGKVNKREQRNQRNQFQNQKLDLKQTYSEQVYPTSNSSANYLLGFQYQEEDYIENQSYGGGKRRRGGRKNARLNKNYSVQSAFKFIVKSGNDYLLNLYDPNENIEWRDVVQIIFNIINAKDVQCPICMEVLDQVIVPRITKCGHVYCWPCILQYLAFEKVKSWKRCPLCNESIYKHELKPVSVVQSHYYKAYSTIKFNLMVRNKANIIVRDKFVNGSNDKTKIPANRFPNLKEDDYHQTRVLLSNQEFEIGLIESDIQKLEEEIQMLQSSHEFEKVPYINEAIEHCRKELQKIVNQSENSQKENETIDFEEKKRRHNKKQTLKDKVKEDDIEENSEDFYYFYQSSTGENLFLHPICYNIFQYNYLDYSEYPLQLEATVLEVNYQIADQDDNQFKKYQYLNHLPDGAPFGFVEVEMKDLVSTEIYRDFEKQISNRERHRQKKLLIEESYSGQVENIQNEKFEQIKREAISNIITTNLKPGVLRNIQYEEEKGENEEEKKEEDENENEQEQERGSKFDKPTEQKLWGQLGSLLSTDNKYAQSMRRDTFEEAELGIAAKKKIEEQKKRKEQNEFECDDGEGFKFASSQIIVMEAKQKKKRRR